MICAAAPMPCRKGLVKRDGRKLPSMRPALPIELPLRGPPQFLIVPDQTADQDDLAAPPGRDFSQLCVRDLRKRQLVGANTSERRGIGQHDGHSPFGGGREQRVPLQIRLLSSRPQPSTLREPCCISTNTPSTGRRVSHGLTPSDARMSLIPAASKSTVRKKRPVPCALFVVLRLAALFIAIGKVTNQARGPGLVWVETRVAREPQLT